jgi:hypothetical protein
MNDRISRAFRQLGALKGAAEWARDAINGKNSAMFPDRERAIESALWVLQRALDHDGSADYFERTCHLNAVKPPRVARSSDELMQQLRDSVAQCDAERAS